MQLMVNYDFKYLVKGTGLYDSVSRIIFYPFMLGCNIGPATRYLQRNQVCRLHRLKG